MSRLFISFFWLCAIVLNLSCEKKQEIFKNEAYSFERDFSNSEVMRILYFKDHRFADSLLKFSTSKNTNTQYELALAAASVQSADLSAELIKSIPNIPQSKIRSAYYYAIGQSSNSEESNKLFEYIPFEKDSLALSFLIEAIAKSGGGDQLIKLLALKNLNSDLGLARALYNFSLKNIFSEESIEKTIDLLNSNNQDVRILVSNSLARLNGANLVKYSEVLVDKLQNDTEVLVRMNIATCFNKLNGNLFAEELIKRICDDKEDFRVKVNAINSCNYYHYETVKDAVMSQLSTSESLKIQLEAAQFFENRCQRDEWLKLAEFRNGDIEVQLKAKVYGVLLKYAGKDEKQAVNSHILKEIKSVTDPFARTFFINALSKWVDNYETISEYIFKKEDLIVNSQAMQCIFELSDKEEFEKIKSNTNVKSYFAQIFKKAILSGDATLMGYGAKGLRNSDINYALEFDDFTFLDVAIDNLDLPKDVETLIDLQKTKAFVSGVEVEDQKPPLNHFIDIAQLEAYRNKDTATIYTNRGEFQISLKSDFCPSTVANFIELSESGFYKNIRFHRVENNFVVQGGCPRGDGWGSSGESVRSEYAPHYYETGSLGMASAGKDTESCQWFVTHYQSNHLDGFYTNFASVISRMDIVNQLTVGDTIINITIK